MLTNEMQQAILEGESEAGGIPERAKPLIEGFDFIQARSQGVFSYTITDIAYPGVLIELTFKKASGDVVKPVALSANGTEMSMGGKDYSREKIYEDNGTRLREGRDPTYEEIVANVLKQVSTTARRCLQLREAQQATPAVPGTTAAAAHNEAAPEDVKGTVQHMREQLARNTADEDGLSARELQEAALAGFQKAEKEITQDKRVGRGLINGLGFIRTQAAGFSYTPDYHDNGGVTITAGIAKGDDITIEVSPNGDMAMDETVYEGTKDNIKLVVGLVAEKARAAQFRPVSARQPRSPAHAV